MQISSNSGHLGLAVVRDQSCAMWTELNTVYLLGVGFNGEALVDFGQTG